MDYEDGDIPDTLMNWSEAQMGVLGTGHSIMLPQGLAPGVHKLTLTAKDSAGLQGQSDCQKHPGRRS